MKVSERFSYRSTVFLGEDGEICKEIEQYFDDDEEAKAWAYEEADKHPSAVGVEIKLVDWFMHCDTDVLFEWFDEWYEN